MAQVQEGRNKKRKLKCVEFFIFLAGTTLHYKWFSVSVLECQFFYESLRDVTPDFMVEGWILEIMGEIGVPMTY